MRMFFLFFFLFLCCHFSFGQEISLVPNNGFEDINKPQKSFAKSNFTFINNVDYWFTPNTATPDLINPLFKTSLVSMGKAHKGKNMAGLRVGGVHHIEYIGIKLKEKLKPNKKYSASFWIRLGKEKNKRHNSFLLNTYFGMLFSNNLFQNDTKIITAKPQVNIGSIEQWVDHKNWVKIEAIFTCTNEFEYLYLGQFRDMNEMASILLGYVLIDDVTVFELPDTLEETEFKKNKPIVLKHVFFNSGNSKLLPSSFSELNRVANYLKNNTNLVIEFIGHTDSQGTKEKNLELSIARAKAVYSYIEKQGVDITRLSFKGYGRTRPIKNNKYAYDRKMNRRVEIVLKEKIKLENSETKVGNNVRHHNLPYSFSSQITEMPSKQDWEYTFIGEYEKALAIYDAQGGAYEKISEKDSLLFKRYTPVSASDYILEKAKTNQIVFINEAHHNPQHRAFTSSILKDFYDIGYRYLGLEALYPNKKIESEEGPVLTSGYYVREPLMADMIRMALDYGFKIFSYEGSHIHVQQLTEKYKKEQAKSNSNVTSINPDGTVATTNYNLINAEMNARDMAQAIKINKVIQENPTAKILIYAGFGHIKERKSADWKPLAYNLNKISGINPLTIDQVRMTSRIDENLESPYYRTANISTPSIYVNQEENQPFVTLEYNPSAEDFYSRFYDIQIFHPRPIYIKNRPNWLSMNGYRKAYDIEHLIKNKTCPCLVKAYILGDDVRTAIPIDVIEVTKNRMKDLMLPSGSYKVIIEDQKRKETISLISIK